MSESLLSRVEMAPGDPILGVTEVSFRQRDATLR